ncbi:unnamed protein product [Rotaria magnacalcarata]
MDKLLSSSSSIQQQIPKANLHTSLSLSRNKHFVVKKNLSAKYLIYPIVAWFLFILLTIIYFIFVCPWYYHNINKIIPIIHGLFVFYVGQNFLQSMCMDPGVYHPCQVNQRRDEFRLKFETKLYSIEKIDFDVTQCTSCFIVKPPRTHHCRYCGYCIDTMDHHCPWLCNCIGRRNYRFFLLFLFTLLIHVNITFICSLYLIIALRENLLQVKVIVSFILVFCTTILTGLVGGLFGLHVIFVSKNITTFEQVTGKFMDVEQTPFNRGIVQNWLRICCVSIIPKLNRYSTDGACQKCTTDKHLSATNEQETLRV